MVDRIAIELDAGGRRLSIEWPGDALAGKAGWSAGEQPWRLEGEIDWAAFEALRVITAPLPDGRAAALAAVRPAGSEGHGEEAVTALLVADGAVEEVAEPLLSVESGSDGLPRRVGLELHTAAEAMPLRIAGDVTEAGRERGGTVERIWAALEVRLDGKRSAGAYEVLTGAAPAGR